MEFFCELWIRGNINIRSNISKYIRGGRGEKKKYRSVDTFALSDPSVSRPTNNTENGWLVRWLLSARTKRGKKENGRKIIKRLLLFHGNLFAIIFVQISYIFFFRILSKSTLDKLTIWELFIRCVTTSVCPFTFLPFLFLSAKLGGLFPRWFPRSYDDLSATNLWASFTLPVFLKLWRGEARSQTTNISPRPGARNKLPDNQQSQIVSYKLNFLNLFSLVKKLIAQESLKQAEKPVKTFFQKNFLSPLFLLDTLATRSTLHAIQFPSTIRYFYAIIYP